MFLKTFVQQIFDSSHVYSKIIFILRVDDLVGVSFYYGSLYKSDFFFFYK